MSETESVTDRPVPATFGGIVEEIYQGESGGEAFFCEMLTRFREPDQQYKLGSLLQLETELKARLRPLVFQHGAEIAEDVSVRRQIAELAHQFDGQSWEEFIEGFAETVSVFVERFHVLAAAMPPDKSDLGKAVIEHEESIAEFAHLERAGKTGNSIDRVVRQLIHPLPPPA